MGIGTGVDSMSTTADVIYTHKKFKRPAAEAWESKETKKNAEQTTCQQSKISEVLPTTTNSHHSSIKQNISIPSASTTLSFNGHAFDKSSHAVFYKGGNKLMCTLCGFVSSKQNIFDEHVCMHSRQGYFHPVSSLAGPIPYHTRRGSLEVSITTKPYPNEVPSKVPPISEPPTSTHTPKVSFNRSHSLPFGASTLKNVEVHQTDKLLDNAVSCPSGSKQIYKPKFRAQYSFQESNPSYQAALNLNSSSLHESVKNNEVPITLSSNVFYPSSPFVAYQPSTAQPPPMPNPGLLQTPTHLGKPAQEGRSSKLEEVSSLPKGTTSSYPSIWKGIKSPSPGLVGQHITNLIVQNQAIVETHNPLWSIKYRRQSSIGSPLADGEGGTSQKVRKLSDATRSSKSHHSSSVGSCSSPERSSLEAHGDVNSSSLSSLPRSYFYPHAQSSSPPVRASKYISSSSIPTSSHLPKVNNADVYNASLIPIQHETYNSSPIIVKNHNYAFISEASSESLDLSSKSSKTRSNSSSHCNDCTASNLQLDNEPRVLNLKYNSQVPPYSQNKPAEPGQILESKRYEEQEVALDLHKRPSQETERSSSRSSSGSEHSYIYSSNNKQLPSDETTRRLSMSPSHFHGSPPSKRQRLSSSSSSSEIFINEKVSYSPVFAHNGKMASKNDYRMLTLGEYGKPKGNSHHMYGGEVQICDGKETKTLKIDSKQSDAPSLHLSIASKHLGVDLESKESQLPTSVVVTIAKCGLNSGGTMVKVDNQGSNTFTGCRKTTYNSPNGQNTGTSSTAKSLQQHDKALKLQPLSPSAMPPTSASFHPSLIHYSHVPPIDVRGVSPSSLNAVSLHLLKAPPMQTPLTSDLSSGTLYDSPGAPNPVRINPVASGHRETEPTALHKPTPSLYPSVISIGGEVIPHVPGMPGPYSQAGVVLKSSAKLAEPLSTTATAPEAPTKVIRTSHGTLYPSTSAGFSPLVSTVMTYSSLNVIPSSAPLERSKLKEYIYDSSYSSSKVLARKPVNNAIIKPPEIIIQPPPQELASTKGEEKTNKSKGENESKNDASDDKKTFLMPRKRPNTLIIKPQSPSVNKSSLSLIGSTLVSPDTPRPKKSCAQLLLNGSAYTYLNLKVSTKTFFCCIYRPQPMYGLQSSNPKLSMYSNWQTVKTEDPLNISPPEAMSLHISGSECNRAYTIAKPKASQLILTDSSWWTRKKEAAGSPPKHSATSKDPSSGHKRDAEELETPAGIRVPKEKAEVASRKERKESEAGLNPKRIRIFEGGFKTNEDYTYVRGRGRGLYVCETCGIRCKKPSMLKKHIRTHTDLRPFACKPCSFSFKTKGNLTKHLKSKAHFKRCTEMGIVPVPVSVNESHINEEALHLQGGMEKVKDSSHNTEDDEEEEDDEDDDEEEDDDDEEEEEEEEDDEDLPEKSRGEFRSTAIVSTSSDFTLRSVEDAARTNLLEDHFAKSHSETLAPGSKPSSRGITPSPVDSNSMPMDLSLKRPALSSRSPEDHRSSPPPSSSSRESQHHLRPSHLPLVKRLSLDATKCSSATTPIREQPEDILSPVTESSLVLKSIYSTTRKLASSSLDKRSPAVSDHTKGDSRFQTYLTERAVLDCARKRHQYLSNASEDSSSLGATGTLSLSTVTNNSGPTSYSFRNSSPLQQRPKNPTVSEEVRAGQKGDVPSTVSGPAIPVLPVHSSAVGSESSPPSAAPEKTSVSEATQGPPVSTDSVCKVSSPGHTSVSDASGAFPSPASPSASSRPRSPPPQASSVKLGGASLPSASDVTQSVCSAGTTTIITTPRTSGSGGMSVAEVRLTSGRKATKGSYSGNGTVNSPMPTPPANLTVLKGCSGDSKTAFIAPSGVIPSSHNNRMGSDDGKCKCSVCHKEFAKQGQLRLHMNIHYIERPHRCDSCGISFRTNGHLQKHKRSLSHYNKVNMNMTFGTPSTNNPRPFKCHDCKSAFRIYGHLAKHLRSKLHIMRLECLGKLPFGTYAEIERSGVNLNEIDTSDCENSLESLQMMASKLYEKEPAKLLAWQNQQQQLKQSQSGEGRERTVSSSSTNSEDYPILDEHESGASSSASTSKSNEDESGEEDDPMEGRLIDRGPNENSSSCSPSSSSSSPVASHPPYEIGSGATEGLLGCPKCHQKFLDVKNFEIHHYAEHENPSSKEGQDEPTKGTTEANPSSYPPAVTKL